MGTLRFLSFAAFLVILFLIISAILVLVSIPGILFFFFLGTFRWFPILTEALSICHASQCQSQTD